MGKGGGGSAPAPAPTSQTVTQTNLPEYAKPYFENVMNRAQAESYRAYQPYTGQRVAGFTPGQTQVQTETLGMPSTAPIFGAAGLGSLTAGTQYGAMATDPTAQQAYMSPYMQNVVDVQKTEAIRDAAKQQMQANLGAARQGTYGGARNILAQTEANRNLGAQLANIQAAGSQKAFEAAQQAQQYQADLGLRGLGQAAQLAQLGQQTDLQRLTAQEAVGAQQQAQQQKMLDQAYSDFLRQRDYPMEQLGYFSNILRGLPVQLGSTATTYAQPPSLTSQVGGLGLAGLGLYKMMG